MFEFRPVLRSLAVLLSLSCSLFAAAQTPEPRLYESLGGAERQTLPGSRSPLADAAQDLGVLPSGTMLRGITLVFKRSSAQTADLNALLAAQGDRKSPLYHQWLTPGAFAARFGMADADLAATRAWLTAGGFTVDSVPPSHDRITFTGNAAQVNAAFGTELHRFLLDGEHHFAPLSDLKLPAALVPLTATVLHLSDLHPRPAVHAPAHPAYTVPAAGVHYLTPGDAATMYNLGAVPVVIGQGAGSGLAIVGESYVNPGDSVSEFQFYTYGYTAISSILVPGTGIQAAVPGSQAEGELDLEYASGIAQHASVSYIYVGDSPNYNVFDSLTYAIQQNVAPVVSISYGLCETLLNSNDLDQFNDLFMQAASQGQTLVASSGDSGSTGCARFTGTGLTTTQLGALALDFPADSPYITAVGGTEMAPGTFAAGNSQYWGAGTNPSGAATLLSYVPETVWNEGSPTRGILAGGGGMGAYYPRPSWQAGVPGMPGGAFRLVPDVSLLSAIQSPGFLICTSDPDFLEGEGQTRSCVNALLGSNNGLTIAGGTSFAAPMFAGFLADLNQANASLGQGNINPTLYGLASDPATYASAFHDITSGSNACIAGATGCTAAGLSGFSAGPGFDVATGLGSVDFGHLFAVWPTANSGAPGLQPTLILVQAAATSAAPGDSVPVQILINSAGSSLPTTLPTGSLSLSVDGVVVNPSLALTAQATSSSGIASYTFVAPPTAGSHLLQIFYGGDATHTPAQTTFALLVGNVVASGSLSLSAADLTLTTNGNGTSAIVVTPSAGYHGRVVWSLSATGGVTGQTICYGISSVEVNATGTTPATLYLGAGSACGAASSAHQPAGGALTRTPARAQLQPEAPPSVPGNHGHAPAIALSAGLLLCGALWKRRRHPQVLTVVFGALAALSSTLIGCGGGSGNTSTPTPTPTPAPISAPFTLTLTGQDSVNSSITASTSFTLTVN